MILLQMTGGCSSTAYYPRFTGHAAALSRVKTACFIADVFAVTASSCADTQRHEPFLVPIFLSVHNPLRLSYEPVRWEVPVTLQGFS